MLKDIEGLGLWMLTDPKSEKKYHRIINKCSDLYQSEPFLPHITISRVPELPIEIIADRMLQISSIVSPFEMSPQKVVCRNEPYQKICIEFSANSYFITLTDEIDRSFQGSFSKKKDPHLSLLYSDIPCRSLNHIVNQLQDEGMIQSPFHCSRLGLVKFSGTPSSWNMIHSVAL